MLFLYPTTVMMYPASNPSVHPSFQTLFLDNSFYSFNWIALKRGGELDNKVIQHILFRGYSTSNFERVIMLFNDFSDFDFVSG